MADVKLSEVVDDFMVRRDRARNGRTKESRRIEDKKNDLSLEEKANGQRKKLQECVNQDAQECEELAQIHLRRKTANLNDTPIPSFPQNLTTSVQQLLMQCGMPIQQVSATSTSSHRYSYC
ncbi:hypothetical protein KIN20_018638 [Parelaphostrongylus tenuis]|uniref:Uncharacterized protein n=1 Tax=Parelaphostrongylus tenuis TaxID=148309 RepID=A0AAD5MK94_PARTN|nr:hypothetical protein KIN20_018638 [Parelaphostrongylus tenuis]